MKKVLWITLLALCLGIFVCCLYQFYNQYTEDTDAEEVFAKLAQTVHQPSQDDVNENAKLDAYQELTYINSDIIGWIYIEETTIDYPVMHTPENPNYYLTHDFYGESSVYGVPYMSADCTLDGDNIIIYSHHIKGHKMFGALIYYEDKIYYEQHQIIHFDTLDEERTYQIIAVFKTSVGEFNYYDITHAENEEEYNAYISKVKELALYETGISAEYGDQLITLSTCEYSVTNGRLVIVAKRETN